MTIDLQIKVIFPETKLLLKKKKKMWCLMKKKMLCFLSLNP